MAKKTTTGGKTPQTQFRFAERTLAQLDELVRLALESGRRATRADVLREMIHKEHARVTARAAKTSSPPQ